MILGRHNAHLTVIKDEDDVQKWSGDAEANLSEQLLEGEDRLGQIWRSHLTVPSNLPTAIEPGDKVTFTWNAVTNTREVRDVLDRRLFGYLRLHFQDR